MSHNIVIVSAHPDDMEIGMGGTIANLAKCQAVFADPKVTAPVGAYAEAFKRIAISPPSR